MRMAALGLLATLALGAPVQAVQSGSFIAAHRGESIPKRGGSAESVNWSGYVVQQSNVTGVDGSFTVPTVDGTPGFSSVWAGIGGFGTSDLIQAGVEVDSLVVGAPFAWYEVLPNNEVPLTNCSPDPNCTVHEGDAVAVHIHQTSLNQWVVSVADSSAGWTFSVPQTYPSRRLSAEWILESPTVLGLQSILPLMHDTEFAGANTFSVGGGAPQSIASGNPTLIEMNPIAAGVPIDEGSPTPIDGTGEEFTACAYPLLGCPSNVLLNLL